MSNNLKDLAMTMKIDDLCEHLRECVEMELVNEARRNDGIDFISKDHDTLFLIVLELADYSYEMSDEILEEFKVVIDMSKDRVSLYYLV